MNEHDAAELSEMIFKSTGIMISPTDPMFAAIERAFMIGYYTQEHSEDPN